MMPTLELHLQYEAPHPELSESQITLWVQTALNEAIAVYTESDLSPPFHQVVFTLRFCSPEEGRNLNHQYRDKDYATNVLTFEYGIDPTGTLSGDIIICTAVLEQEALDQNKAFVDHAAHLCVHGVLHALGYDHLENDDAEEMEGLEIDILHLLGIANPYSAI